jgi:hypothetical protein
MYFPYLVLNSISYFPIINCIFNYIFIPHLVFVSVFAFALEVPVVRTLVPVFWNCTPSAAPSATAAPTAAVLIMEAMMTRDRWENAEKKQCRRRITSTVAEGAEPLTKVVNLGHGGVGPTGGRGLSTRLEAEYLWLSPCVLSIP